MSLVLIPNPHNPHNSNHQQCGEDSVKLVQSDLVLVVRGDHVMIWVTPIGLVVHRSTGA